MKTKLNRMENRITVNQTTPTFFLRFYGRTEDEVEKFLNKLKNDYPLIQHYTIKPLIQSINFMISTPTELNHQANLFFDNDVDKEATFKNQNVYRRYKRFAVGTVSKHTLKNITYHKRKPGDAAFEAV